MINYDYYGQDGRIPFPSSEHHAELRDSEDASVFGLVRWGNLNAGFRWKTRQFVGDREKITNHEAGH